MKISHTLLVISCAVCLLVNCILHDTSRPLENDIPECVDCPQSIGKTLVYPDTALCTLSIADLNDTSLTFDLIASSGFASSPEDTCAWPGTACFINRGFDTKKAVLSLPLNMDMGEFSGTIFIRDHLDGSTYVPFQVSRIWWEKFNEFPPDSVWWRTYLLSIENHLFSDYVVSGQFVEERLRIIFNPADSVDSQTVAGISSSFGLSGDFCISADFGLRDDMMDGFEAGFYLSNTRSAPLPAGSRQAGIYLSGLGQWVNIKCKSINFQNISQVIDYYSGTLMIARNDSTVAFFCKPALPGSEYTQLASFYFPPDDTIYAHLQLKISDFLRIRHCTWDNVLISKGLITF